MKTILIIEDAKTLQDSYKYYLGRENDYTCAATANLAITYLKTMSFDHVICDYNLDRGTGRDVYEWLTENKPDQLKRFTFVCGLYGDVADLDACHLQKGTSSLEYDLLERIEDCG